MSSLSVYKPANLFIIVSKYFFPIPLLKISSVTVSADVFLYQPEFPWLNSSNIYLLTLLNADTFSFASHLSPAILHSGLNSFPLFQFRFIIFQVHKKSLIAFLRVLQTSTIISASPFRNGMIWSIASIVSFLFPLSNIAVTEHSSVSKFIARFIIILHPPSYVLWIFLLLYFPAPVLLPLPETLSTTAVQIFSVLLSLYKNEAVIANTIHNTK